jgi:eukaryotic-like serine/threonine-protein kinase
MIGKSLLHYDIQEKIGAGGMGEVYRAFDTKLRRDVALKLLPPELLHGSDKMARFEREARVLAALNHPHVGAIYGLESDGDKTFLVLELVPGEDLGEILKRGAMLLDDVLKLGRQIAEGMEAAHEQGIIHRDLKPQNIMITPEGTVKILDFGLAKAFEVEPQGGSQTAMPTMTSGHTIAGVVMGTASYMSPEQARGTPLDRRTDIWSFGCVIYEMLGGRQVFEGETVSDVLASVLKTEPDWTKLPADVPPVLVRLIRRCFERDPRRRLRDIGEARVRLEAMIAGDWGDEPGLTEVVTGPSRGRIAVMIIAAGLLLGAAGLFVGNMLQDKAPERQLRRFALAVTQSDQIRRNDPVISHDGRRVVYEQGGELWIHELDQLEPRRLEGIEKAEAPFWSPDGSEIGFFERSQMWRVPVTGGQKKLVCDLGGDVAGGRGAHWGEDGTILFSRGNSGILSAAAVGGDARLEIAVNDSTEGDLHEPFRMPDGGIMFVVHPQGVSPGRLVIEKDGARRVLLDYPDKRIWYPRYDGQGHIIYERDGSTNNGVWVLPYDEMSGLAAGDPILIVPDGGRPSVSRDGLLIYSLNPITGGQEQMVWVDRNGGVLEEITPVLPNLGSPELSPDGRFLALSINEGQEVDLWVQDLRRGTRQRLPVPGVMDVQATWTPTGDELYFYSMPPSHKIFRRTLDATSPLDTLVAGSGPSLNSDASLMAFVDYKAGNPALHVMKTDGSGESRPIFSGPDEYEQPVISPDDRFVAYISNESGRNEVYMRTFPDGGHPVRVSLDGGEEVRWSRDGHYLYYVSDDRFYEVAVSRGERPELGQPVVLFEERGGDFLFDRGFAVSMDKDRFIFAKLASREVGEASVEIVALDQWVRLLGEAD